MKQKNMFFWISLAFSMIQWTLAIWSLVSLPFPNPACTSGGSQCMHCWSAAYRVLSVTLQACETSAAVQCFEHSLALPFFGTGMKTHFQVFLCRPDGSKFFIIRNTEVDYNLCVHAQLLSQDWLFCNSHGVKFTRLLCPWDYPGKNTGVGCPFFLHGLSSQPRNQTHISYGSCFDGWIRYTEPPVKS